jgi:hypothetical protein
MKTKVLHNGQNQFSFHLIKGFLHVHLKEHKTTFPSLELEGVKEFMSYDGVVLNVSIWHKSRLEGGYDLREEKLESICQHLGSDLVRDIAKTNRPKLVHRISTCLFWNQSDECMVLFFGHFLVKEKIPNAFQNFTLDYTPVFFVEEG